MALILDGDGSISGIDEGIAISGVTTITGDIHLTENMDHVGDEDTRIRFPAADTFSIETAGSEALRVDSSQRVGIGTDDPTEKLYVLGDARVTGILTVGTASVTIDGTNSRIGIESSSPRVAVDLSQATDGIALPVGTQAQRPTGVEGYMRFNSESKALEIYNGTNWVEIISDYFPQGSVVLG